MKRLYFIRHGQSEANVARVFGGQSETPLTALGKQQAIAAGKTAKGLNIDHIIASPLGRAHETAILIAREMDFPVKKIELNSLLMERGYGPLEGKSWDLDVDMDGIVDIETIDAVMERAKLAYAHLQQLTDDNVLVVSHGTFLRALRSVVHPEIDFANGDELANATIVQLV